MGSVEHVSGGGEIRLNRDERFRNPDDPSIGVFTLESVQEFCLEAEVAGVAPTEQMWFRFMISGRVECLYFPTEGHVDYRPAQEAPTPFTGYSTQAVALVAAICLFIGMLFGMVMIGG